MRTKFDYKRLMSDIKNKKLAGKKLDDYYRYLIQNDLYFILRYVLNIETAEHQFVYDRAMEVQRDNVYSIDLWARGHYKSTLITISLTLQELINNPKLSFCIFSHTNPIAHAFLRSIKNILKNSDFLHRLYPDIIPEPTSNLLSDERIIMIPNKQRKEPSVMASGLVDGQPTGMHYDIRVYDDIVVPESVSTPDQINKLQERFELSHNLASHIDIARVIGTRYHYSDLFSVLLEQRNIWKTVRIYSAYNKDGEPNLLTHEELEKKKEKMGSYVFNCQMLLNPQPEGQQVFKPEDINFYDKPPHLNTLKNIYILVDPAISKNKFTACYFVAMVVASTHDHKIYVLDYFSDIGVLPRDQVNAIYRLKIKYKARIAIEQVAYQQALKYYVQDKFKDEGLPVPNILELKANKSKEERILSLQPYVENGQIYLSKSHKRLYEEITQYPFYKYKDHLDVLAYYPQFMPVKRKVDKETVMSDNVNRTKNNFKRGKFKWRRQM